MSQSPIEDPTAWKSIGFGDFKLPLIPSDGQAITKMTSEFKKDNKTAKGKSKATTTNNGVEVTKGVTKLTCRKDAWPATQQVLKVLDPNGALGGQPLDVDHPDAETRNLKSVQITKIGGVDWKDGGWIFEVDITWEEWHPPAAAKATGQGGGSKTPDASQGWVEYLPGGVPIGSNGNVVGGMLPTTAKDAYNGPDAPSSKPKT